MILSAGIVNDLPVVESWERTNALDDYRGDKANMSIVTSPLLDGSRALAYETSGGADGAAMVLWDSAGDTVETDVTYTYGARWNQDEQNCRHRTAIFADSADTGASDLDAYVIEVNPGTGGDGLGLHLYDFTGGTDGSPLASTSITVSPNTWYEPSFSVDTSTSPNTIKVQMDDDSGTQTISATDDTHTSGDHGFGGYDGQYGDQEVYHDFLRATSEEPLP